MKKKQSFISSPLFYILFFLIGTIVFFIMIAQISIPIYETYNGKVEILDNKVIVVMENTVPIAEKVFYYTNRDEWVEVSNEYCPEYSGYLVENVRDLSDGTIVKVDIPVGTISLVEAVFKKGGNV